MNETQELDEHVNDELQTEAGTDDDVSTWEGATPPLQTWEEKRVALEAAFDYRGDVTVELHDGTAHVGYLFDRRLPDTENTDEAQLAEQATARIMLTEGGNVTVQYSEISRLHFSGRDTAAGKSWETWLKEYATKVITQEAHPSH